MTHHGKGCVRQPMTDCASDLAEHRGKTVGCGWTSGIIIAAAIFFISVSQAGAVNPGPVKIDIFGGSLGNVPFPNADHQKRIKDCKVCHHLFPQQADATKAMKEKGTMKPKSVMNGLCIKCHRQEKLADRPHGPLMCKKCHTMS
jgi:Cytochrome c7 and related cytochrome c